MNLHSLSPTRVNKLWFEFPANRQIAFFTHCRIAFCVVQFTNSDTNYQVHQTMDTSNTGGVDQKMDDISEPHTQASDKEPTCGVKHKLDDVDKEARKKQKIENKQQKKTQHQQNRPEKKFQKNQQQKIKKENEGVVTAAQLKETTYTIKNGLRHVTPYYFNFEVHSKGRWENCELLDLFTKEFSQLPKQTYEAKIKRGDIRVNGETVSTNYLVQNKDKIIHRVHRHEPPVTAAPVSILYANDEFVVVNKPGSMPVHPCGRFRHNSLLFVLASELGENKLYTVNRLDRLTSGLLVMARTSAIAARLASQISSNLVEKQYLARVAGQFPEGEVVVDQPIKAVNHREGINSVSPDGKPSKTIFVRKSFDKESNTSVVQCKPVTGRTHQIRVHLQHLGHPIANDPVYNNDPKVNKLGLTSDGNSLPLFGEDDDDIISPLSSLPPNPTQTTTEMNNNNNNINNNNNNSTENNNENNNGKNGTTKEVDPECTDCSTLRTDPKPEDMYIYLHAYSYKGPDWHFETELPLWAHETYKK